MKYMTYGLEERYRDDLHPLDTENSNDTLDTQNDHFSYQGALLLHDIMPSGQSCGEQKRTFLSQRCYILLFKSSVQLQALMYSLCNSFKMLLSNSNR